MSLRSTIVIWTDGWSGDARVAADRSEVSERGAGAVVEVADHGPGIQAGDEKRIFERFHRPASARADRDGSGLGLAIVKALVEAHGGTVDALNSRDGGATLRFWIPATRPDDPPNRGPVRGSNLSRTHPH
jgi:signal transduction histidine kinase